MQSAVIRVGKVAELGYVILCQFVGKAFTEARTAKILHAVNLLDFSLFHKVVDLCTVHSK